MPEGFKWWIQAYGALGGCWLTAACPKRTPPPPTPVGLFRGSRTVKLQSLGSCPMGRLVDLDDLIDVGEVTARLHLARTRQRHHLHAPL